MSTFKCKMCGGTIEFEQGATVGVCDSCGTKQTLPRLDDERRANWYDRANHFRRNNDFDKASGIYEQILNEDTSDAEAYWSLVLCRYGIEYVEDPASHKRIPTINRAQFTSIFDDDNYKSAIQYADSYQRMIYEEEAKAINEIQKGILAISQKEDPFDVFICYKETDNSGRRTPDSVLANDLYHQLKQEGFKVFFARITLEDKLGTAYEPYIFAALNSAKVMVVLGTKPENFNAVWVKNEWSRYLALVKQSGGKKVLIPAYRDMDPYDLPEEFSHLQAQDMSKLGFMQDLIRGIKKIAKADESKATAKETVVVSANNANVATLLKRAFMYLEDGEWQSADEYCEKVLDQDPENAEAYLGKLMAEQCVRHRKELAGCKQPFNCSNNYKKAIRFGDETLKAELTGYITRINDRNETARLTGIYNNALSAMKAAKSESAFKSAAQTFLTISEFQDANTLADQCLEKAEISRKDAIYAYAISQMNQNTVGGYEAAIKTFGTISEWKDANEQICVCQRKMKAKEEADRVERERQTELKKIEDERKAEEMRIAKIKTAKRRKIIAIVSVAVIIVCIGMVFLSIYVIKPASIVNKANQAYASGDYKSAVELFETISNYKDCLLSEAYFDSVYHYAIQLENTSIAESVLNYRKLPSGYSDVASRLNEIAPYLKWCRVYGDLEKPIRAFRTIYCDEVETRVFRKGDDFCWQLYIYSDDTYTAGRQLFSTYPIVSLADGLSNTSYNEESSDGYAKDSYSISFSSDFNKLYVHLTCKAGTYEPWSDSGSYSYKKQVIE